MGAASFFIIVSEKRKKINFPIFIFTKINFRDMLQMEIGP